MSNKTFYSKLKSCSLSPFKILLLITIFGLACVFAFSFLVDPGYEVRVREVFPKKKASTEVLIVETEHSTALAPSMASLKPLRLGERERERDPILEFSMDQGTRGVPLGEATLVSILNPPEPDPEPDPEPILVPQVKEPQAPKDQKVVKLPEPEIEVALSTVEKRMLNRAYQYKDLVNGVLNSYWPDMPIREFLPAQVEKESLWVPTAKLCVPRPSCSREMGLGFGQFTVTPRMNVWKEVKRKHEDLASWKWEDRFDPRLQLTAMTVYNKELYSRCRPLMSNDWGGMACTASSYNGGFGGFQADRRLCSNTRGCNPRVWTNNIETHSTKSKTRVPGYGEPFYYINRGYVKFVMVEAPGKYKRFVSDLDARLEP